MYLCMKSIKERVAEVLAYKNINVNRASKMLGIPQRTLNRQVNEDGKIGMDLLYAIMDCFPEISPAWLLLGEGEMLRDDTFSMRGVPYYSDLPVSAGLRDTIDPLLEKPTGYISLPSQKAECYFPVVGTSMEPEIYEGDIVGVVRVNSLSEISPGSIYLIIANNARMIKHCYPDNDNSTIMWCVSPNYPSFPLDKREITALFRVVNRIVTF